MGEARVVAKTTNITRVKPVLLSKQQIIMSNVVFNEMLSKLTKNNLTKFYMLSRLTKNNLTKNNLTKFLVKNYLVKCCLMKCCQA